MVYAGYATIAQIKPRLLISSATTTYDTELEIAGTEASRIIDEKIRPYKSYSQLLVLKAAGYVNCNNDDLGKIVCETKVAKGVLLSFDNGTRTWQIKSSWTFTADAAITILNGVGKGTANAASTNAECKEPFIFYTIPLTAAYIPDIIKEICADLAAGLFKRRQKPERYDEGWLNQGYTKLADFIRANWHQGTFHFSTTEAEG